MLYENKEDFEQLILKTSKYHNISQPAIVEKDYYVALLLKEITKQVPYAVFKGGTSLSKAYKIINRFSEDIDLNLMSTNGLPTIGERKHFNKTIESICKGFNLNLEKEIFSGQDYNVFIMDMPKLFESKALKSKIVVETSLSIESYPCEQKEISSLIYDYLKSQNRFDLIEKYGVEPFLMQVQSKERTFIDKIFAICDYYLNKKIKEHSRHLYDLHKLYPLIDIDDNLHNLFCQVKSSRQNSRQSEYCLSAQDDVNLKEILKQITEQKTFKTDYNQNTKNLIYDEEISYEDTINTLQKIMESKLFNS